jgi:hypothetical protein
MGAWGALAFDNDDANDWANGLNNVSNLSLVVSALAQVQGCDTYLEAPVASNALAACEVLARLMGRPGYQNPYTETVDQWVSRHRQVPSREILARADSVIDRILADNSELRDLWEEGDASEWIASVEDLRSRLRG